MHGVGHRWSAGARSCVAIKQAGGCTTRQGFANACAADALWAARNTSYASTSIPVKKTHTQHTCHTHSMSMLTDSSVQTSPRTFEAASRAASTLTMSAGTGSRRRYQSAMCPTKPHLENRGTRHFGSTSFKQRYQHPIQARLFTR